MSTSWAMAEGWIEFIPVRNTALGEGEQRNVEIAGKLFVNSVRALRSRRGSSAEPCEDAPGRLLRRVVLRRALRCESPQEEETPRVRLVQNAASPLPAAATARVLSPLHRQGNCVRFPFPTLPHSPPLYEHSCTRCDHCESLRRRLHPD